MIYKLQWKYSSLGFKGHKSTMAFIGHVNKQTPYGATRVFMWSWCGNISFAYIVPIVL